MQRPLGMVFRLIGLALLTFLLVRLDRRELAATMRLADMRFVVIAIMLNVPLVCLRAWRWSWLLRSQHIEYGIGRATLSYFGSIFVGLLTPGRLGEFVKTLHVSQDCAVSIGRAFSSVLADRLFDLSVLCLVGGIALCSLTSWRTAAYLAGFIMVGLLLALLLGGLLSKNVWVWLATRGRYFGRSRHWSGAFSRWLSELRSSYQELTPISLFVALMVTVLAYTVFFAQCYLLAMALQLPVGFVTTSYAVALGGLVTLLPISISGLGTREAAIIAYLSAAGVSAEAAFGFSLLVFAAFYVAGGLMGAVAWWIKPVGLSTVTIAGRRHLLRSTGG